MSSYTDQGLSLLASTVVTDFDHRLLSRQGVRATEPSIPNNSSQPIAISQVQKEQVSVSFTALA